MKKMKIKQGTRAWETAKETRIGSSEVFDIVRYYATDSELQNCGIDAEKIREELPFVSTWSLYHKIINDGIYQKALLDPSLGEYGLAMEQYGLKLLQENRVHKLKKGEVFLSDNLIASLDISGISEEIDCRGYDFGPGFIRAGEKFVCEQKTIKPFKTTLPLKYVIQAQDQISMSKYKFFMLQLMILENDTDFERGKIVSLANTSKTKFYDYIKDKVKVQYVYFNHNEALSQLIKTCLDRFFKDVKERKEPKPFLESNKVSNILVSIRENSFYNPDLTKEFDLSGYIEAKEISDDAEKLKSMEMEKIIHFAMENNCSKFVSPTGHKAFFSSNGRFYINEPKEKKEW